MLRIYLVFELTRLVKSSLDNNNTWIKRHYRD
jgi:hypothetical protein